MASDLSGFYLNIPCWVITIFAAVMFFILFPFSLYHIWLMSVGRTTNEEVRNKYYQWKGNPFDRGTCCSNIQINFKTFPSAVFNPQPVPNESVDQVQVYENRYEIKWREIQRSGMFANIDLDLD